jgi:hypothetical protein
MDIFDAHLVAFGENAPIPHEKLVGCVIENAVPSTLRFKQNCKRRVAVDVNSFDRVHLDPGFQPHSLLTIVVREET